MIREDPCGVDSIVIYVEACQDVSIIVWDFTYVQLLWILSILLVSALEKGAP